MSSPGYDTERVERVRPHPSSAAESYTNLEHTLELWRRSHEQGDALCVFPELGLCGYTTRDLLLDHHLQQASAEALLQLASLDALVDLGRPIPVVTRPSDGALVVGPAACRR